MCYFGRKNVLCKFSTIIKQIDAKTATSNGAIWEKFSKNHNAQLTLFWCIIGADLVHILVGMESCDC